MTVLKLYKILSIAYRQEQTKPLQEKIWIWASCCNIVVKVTLLTISTLFNQFEDNGNHLKYLFNGGIYVLTDLKCTYRPPQS